jgi:putative toxin-antitoxin system antitoxin component (TIGR02293 family)
MPKLFEDERSAAPDVEEYRKRIRSGRPGAYYYVRLLGLETDDPLKLVARVQRGLPYGSVERFLRNTALSIIDLAQIVQIPVRTLMRRKAQRRLQPDESDRLLRASRIFGRALELFEGDIAAARRWLSTPLRAFGGARPFAVAGTDVGAREVDNLIGRLEHGIPT